MLLITGVVLVGLVLLYEVIRALVTGNTYGYYKSHVYTRAEQPGSFYLWLLLRGLIASLALAAGLMLG